MSCPFTRNAQRGPTEKERETNEREGGMEKRKSGNKNKRLMALGTRSICFPVAVAMSLPLVLCNVLTFDTSLGFSDPHRYRRSSPTLFSSSALALALAPSLSTYLPRQGYCSLVRVSATHFSSLLSISVLLAPFFPLPSLLSSLVTFLFDNILHFALRVFRVATKILDILPTCRHMLLLLLLSSIHIRLRRPIRVHVRVQVRLRLNRLVIYGVCVGHSTAFDLGCKLLYIVAISAFPVCRTRLPLAALTLTLSLSPATLWFVFIFLICFPSFSRHLQSEIFR